VIKILILGSTGLLGSTLLKYFSKKNNFKCYGAIRNKSDTIKLKNIKNIKLYKINYKKRRIIRSFCKRRGHPCKNGRRVKTRKNDF
jgi:dTDP-4-dehydrorhamnose reductase